MARKMLINASHPEEIRMAVMDGGRLDEFEIETLNKRQLKGNIYLAKVIRIEPSLQAAFVEFGGNRQGFLPFSEIHPDYYHIPVGDRKDSDSFEEDLDEEINIEKTIESSLTNDEESIEKALSSEGEEASDDVPELSSYDDLNYTRSELQDDEEAEQAEVKALPIRYRYKIQEVVKRRQIMLVQVVKEERGNKGAALTTYLSLAGRYCVLMPNAGERHGGVSRKIQDSQDRKRLRSVLESLNIPETMSLIVRTAGHERNKTEIKRDFEYLLRLWSETRDKTLSSIAPSVIYEEGDLIKRAIRDIYSKDVDTILIEGDEAYKTAKNFMKMMLPSHAKKVQQFKDKKIPMFQHFGIEDQIDQMFAPSVNLPSGGSIVIAQTEALVAIDVNSGKSTKERNIDETALKTNIEAAKEIARQMRLRDLAGIIVVDFIDMHDKQHIANVEKTFKDAVQIDRARIQIGKISQFGLLELSRQRLRPSILESNTKQCPHCLGSGVVRSVDSMALFVLRQIEAKASENPNSELYVTVPADVDLYLLNQKRHYLVELENKYKIKVSIRRDGKLKSSEYVIDFQRYAMSPKIEKKQVVPENQTPQLLKTPQKQENRNTHRPSKKSIEQPSKKSMTQVIEDDIFGTSEKSLVPKEKIQRDKEEGAEQRENKPKKHRRDKKHQKREAPKTTELASDKTEAVETLPQEVTEQKEDIKEISNKKKRRFRHFDRRRRSKKNLHEKDQITPQGETGNSPVVVQENKEIPEPSKRAKREDSQQKSSEALIKEVKDQPEPVKTKRKGWLSRLIES